MGMNVLFGMPNQHYRTFGVRDLVTLFKVSVLALLPLGFLQTLNPNLMSIQVPENWLAATLLTLLSWTLLRLICRIYHERKEIFSSSSRSSGKRALILGGGYAGLQVAHELQHNHSLGAQVVGFLDDAPDMQGLRIQGIPVLGTTAQLPEIVARYQIQQVIISIPSAKGSTIRNFAKRAHEAGTLVYTVPGLCQMLQGETWKPILQKISIEDLLRREPIELNHAALGEHLRDTVVMVTGAGGSIGSEICRQVAAFGPSRLVLLGRGEGSLWKIERDIRDLFPSLPITLELCDIRNPRRLKQAFLRWRPEIVFHAAAHKHVPYLEEHPEEAMENNIFGTQNVVHAAVSVGTRVFVNISTDKAINPTNVLGASKYIAERVVLMGAQDAPTGSRYVTVRFGNVLASRGSVVPIFQAQIESGGPVTVTHPDMHRYFMTIPEASQLVLQAGLMGENGKVYVMDMGAPVKIVDLATDMIRLAGLEPGRDIKIRFTGIRPGEKLYEEVFNGQEIECPGIHPHLREALLKPLDCESLQAALELLRSAGNARVNTRRKTFLSTFISLIPGYHPSKDGLGRYADIPERTYV